MGNIPSPLKINQDTEGDQPPKYPKIAFAPLE